MAFTQTQLTRLEDMIARGVRSTTYDGERVEYESMEQMLKLRELMRRQLGVADSGRRFAAYDKGV